MSNGHRGALYQSFFENNPELGRYELFGTRPGGQKFSVARVAQGKLEVLDETVYRQLTTGPKAELERLAETRITHEEIARVTDGLTDATFRREVVETLQAHVGRTWRQALDAHQKGGSQ